MTQNRAPALAVIVETAGKSVRDLRIAEAIRQDVTLVPTP
jgi:hypothetical protein